MVLFPFHQGEKPMRFGSDSRRISAGIMAVMILVIVLASFTFLMHEADHHCTGEDCVICCILEQCRNTVKKIGTGAAITVLFAVVSFTVCRLSAECGGFMIPHTPVSGKIRLNN